MNVSPGRHALHAAVLLILLAVAVYLPFQLFGVVPYTNSPTLSAGQMAKLLEGVNLPDYYAMPLPAVSDKELVQQKADFVWCRFCHTLKAEEGHRVGPNLHRIVGRPAGTAAGFPYSTAFLQARDGGMIWTPENLDSFIQPHDYIPGNRMRYKALTDPEQRRRVITQIMVETR